MDSSPSERWNNPQEDFAALITELQRIKNEGGDIFSSAILQQMAENRVTEGGLIKRKRLVEFAKVAILIKIGFEDEARILNTKIDEGYSKEEDDAGFARLKASMEKSRRLRFPVVTPETLHALTQDLKEKSDDQTDYLQRIQRENPEIYKICEGLSFDGEILTSQGEDVMAVIVLVYVALRKQAEANAMEALIDDDVSSHDGTQFLPRISHQTMLLVQKERKNWLKTHQDDVDAWFLKELDSLEKENPEIGFLLRKKSLNEDGSVRINHSASLLIGLSFHRALKLQFEADRMKKDFE